MNNLLIISQDKRYTCFCRSLAIGKRNDTKLIGDKLKELLEKNNISKDKLIKKIGTNFKDSIERIINDKEIPNEKMLKKLIDFFKVDSDYFEEKNLENVLITDNGIVVGEYETNERALKVKQSLDDFIRKCYLGNKPIVFDIPDN